MPNRQNTTQIQPTSQEQQTKIFNIICCFRKYYSKYAIPLVVSIQFFEEFNKTSSRCNMKWFQMCFLFLQDNLLSQQVHLYYSESFIPYSKRFHKFKPSYADFVTKLSSRNLDTGDFSPVKETTAHKKGQCLETFVK